MTSRNTKIAVAALVLTGVAAALFYRDRLAADELARWVDGMGAVGPLVFCVVRIVAAVVLVPGSIMGIAAGAAFGVVPGAIYNLLSSTVGAVAAFLIARFLAPDRIDARLRRDGTVGRLVAGVEAEGWRFVAFVRLVPLFPYNIVNYALGLTRIPLAQYTLATLVCMIPGDIAYVYMGYAARETLAGNTRAWQIGLTALGALAALGFLPRVVSRLRAQATANRKSGSDGIDPR